MCSFMLDILGLMLPEVAPIALALMSGLDPVIGYEFNMCVGCCCALVADEANSFEYSWVLLDDSLKGTICYLKTFHRQQRAHCCGKNFET